MSYSRLFFGQTMTRGRKLAALASLMSVGCVSLYSLQKQKPLLGKSLVNNDQLDDLDDHLLEKLESKSKECDQLIQRYKVRFLPEQERSLCSLLMDCVL